MKTKIYKMFTVFSIVLISMMMWTSAQAQSYQVIPWSNHSNFDNVPYCPCDSIKCVPPAGVTNISWFASGATQIQHGDTLVLVHGFDGQVDCYYTGSQKSLLLRPTSPPTSSFATTATICGIGTMTLADININPYGFNTYTWSNGAITTTITVGAGTHWLTVFNVCGSVSDTITITEHNDNQPNLGPDIYTCNGNVVSLDPGIGYSAYQWSYYGTVIGSDSTYTPMYSGVYVVQTTNTVGGCIDQDTINIQFAMPPSQSIDLVTIDTSNGNNRITWGNTHGNVATVNIYRELTTNNYVLVGTAPYGDGTWTDTVNSRNQPWRYKIALVDTCGNEGAKSSYVQSIHTWVSTDGIGGYTVQWTPYMVENKANVVNQYNIYSGPNLGLLTYLTYVSGTVTVYSMPNFIDSFYVIGAQLTSKSTYTDALSNWIMPTDVVGIMENQYINQLISIYPTITEGPIAIKTEVQIRDIKVYALLGQLILITKEKNFTIPHTGVYFVHITTNQGVMTKKIVVL